MAYAGDDLGGPDNPDELRASADAPALVRLCHRHGGNHRRVVAQSQREGVVVGERVVRRLLKGLQRTRSVGRVRVRTTDSNHPYTR